MCKLQKVVELFQFEFFPFEYRTVGFRRRVCDRILEDRPFRVFRQISALENNRALTRQKFRTRLQLLHQYETIQSPLTQK